ncbi:MAG: lactonase family protein [Acidobacteria bacterium]|nr:lactonase family protein [Acidobacteriota bacterium]MBV9625819.1 lactonase family protein [Acidobacteriota bacterium]
MIAALLLISQAASTQSNQYLVYFGTYTGFKYVHHSRTYGVGESHSKGIYFARFNAATGDLSAVQVAAEVVNPSFLTISPNHKFLYAVSEDPLSVGPPLDHSSYVSAFAIEASTGNLRFLNSAPASGTSTCYISIDHTGRYVFLANFGSGSISVIRTRDDGSLGELTGFIQNVGSSVDRSIQTDPHPHWIGVSPDNRHVIVSDLGLDRVQIYNFDAATGMLSPPSPPFATVYPGGGPRHFAFDPSGRFGYQLSEMSGIVDVFRWDAAKGTLTTVQRVHTVPHDFFGGNHSAELEIHPNGKFLYESNRRTQGETVRGPDTIGVFSIDPSNGTLARIEEVPSGGTMPRNFALDPHGAYLLSANQLSNNVVVFKVDDRTGRLSKTGIETTVDTPVCIKFVPVAP